MMMNTMKKIMLTIEFITHMFMTENKCYKKLFLIPSCHTLVSQVPLMQGVMQLTARFVSNSKISMLGLEKEYFLLNLTHSH